MWSTTRHFQRYWCWSSSGTWHRSSLKHDLLVPFDERAAKYWRHLGQESHVRRYLEEWSVLLSGWVSKIWRGQSEAKWLDIAEWIGSWPSFRFSWHHSQRMWSLTRKEEHLPVCSAKISYRKPREDAWHWRSRTWCYRRWLLMISNVFTNQPWSETKHIASTAWFEHRIVWRFRQLPWQVRMRFNQMRNFTFSKSNNASRGEFSEALFHFPHDLPRCMSFTQYSNCLLLRLDVIVESGHNKKRAGIRRENKSTLYSSHVMWYSCSWRCSFP